MRRPRRGCAAGLGVTWVAGVWLAALQPAAAAVYPLTGPDQEVLGEDQTVQTVYEDTLYDLAHRYSLGSEELIRVNPGIDPWIPGAGKQIMVPGRHILPPGPREGVVINLPEHRLYYYPKPKPGQPAVVITYPVSIGKMDWHTPLGVTHVISKQKNPTWYPPESVRKEHAADGDPIPTRVPPGPDNPLGAFAMRLAVGNGSYMIHGTNNPIAVGLAVTHGCIRMYPEDIDVLYPQVPVGTPVRIINQPVKVAWVDGELLLEAHPPVDRDGQSFEPDVDQFAALLRQAVGEQTVAIHWDYALEVLKRADGVLATVGLEADLSGESPQSAAAGSPSSDVGAAASGASALSPSLGTVPPGGAPPPSASGSVPPGGAVPVPTSESTPAPAGNSPPGGSATAQPPQS